MILILLVLLSIVALTVGGLTFGSVLLIRRGNAQFRDEVACGSVITGDRVRKRDLSFLVDTWRDDPAFDEAIANQDKVDEEMWR